MALKPVSDHIVVTAVSKEETSSAGIIIPDTVDKERPERGKVVAIGPGRALDNGQRSSMDVSVGQIVLFKKYAPDEVKVGSEEFLIISSDDVLAIVE